MLDFTAQLEYLRDVQRTFGSGSDRIDLVVVFSKILLITVPLILVMALWHYRHIIGFTILRLFYRVFAPRTHSIVENYLIKKGIIVNVYKYSTDGSGRKIATARVEEVVNGMMKLQLIKVEPTALNLKNTRVICYTNPFTYSGKKLNSFSTFVASVSKRGSVIKALSLMTPVRYRFIVRRKHSRQRVTREGAIRVKAWEGNKRKSFWMAKPDLQTINNPARYGEKMRLSVENISAGGMRMFILHPKGGLPTLNQGNELILRVSVWNPKSKKFSYFTVVGVIRSRFRGRGGAIGLGIQFTAEGEKLDGRYSWKSLHGEMKALKQFLHDTTR
ncbi:PilZ domain-containing protein [Pseudodesulfovibrio piezophilus]|uniref:PilZ domain-containing protein n=1 Tax=Pseudodesulfovibrio piezophilus (strain DSM 21447 / JCM 15486 / C1TLV30) TaxID=1322246 RepID=M1WLH7_PSEP2|nr:hypothetical protein [Pseudodesulfovibrio piezophilus]CCH47885.1 conserved protein of unknown function [Pseudodesulfovibrio piezophilus C1TLV30]